MVLTALTDSVMAHAGWGGPGWFLLIPLIWIVVLVLLFAFLGRRWRRGWGGPGYPYPGHPGWQEPSAGAEATLAERFAQGDIDEVEYRARLEVLRANRPQGPAPRR